MKNVLLIGASGGIGNKVAELLLKEKFNVVGTYFQHPEKVKNLNETGSFVGQYVDVRDVESIKKLRDFIKEYNTEYESTIILTSHYMEDVKQLCNRVIVIDHGTILFDGKLDNLVKEYTKYKLITVVFEKEVGREKLEKMGKIIEYEFPKAVLSVKKAESNEVTSKLLKDFPVEDLNIQEPDIEDIIREVFSRKGHA